MPTADWGTRFNNGELVQGDRRVDLAIIVFKCKVRPDSSDFNIMAVLMQIIESLKTQNVAIVFTFAD